MPQAVGENIGYSTIKHKQCAHGKVKAEKHKCVTQRQEQKINPVQFKEYKAV